jgi:hypothetical protein
MPDQKKPPPLRRPPLPPFHPRILQRPRTIWNLLTPVMAAGSPSKSDALEMRAAPYQEPAGAEMRIFGLA